MNEKQIPLFDAGDRRILAVLFAAGEPLELERLAEGLGVDKAAMRHWNGSGAGSGKPGSPLSCWSWRRMSSLPQRRNTAT